MNLADIVSPIINKLFEFGVILLYYSDNYKYNILS